MLRRWQKLSGAQRLLALAFVICSVLLILKYGVSLDALPLPENIATAEARAATLREELAALRDADGARDAQFARLRGLAQPFWHTQGGKPSVEVIREFDRLAREAQVKISHVGEPLRKTLPGLNEVGVVEFRVQLSKVSMREVSRLLAKIEQSRQHFFWSTCTIRPDNRRAPKMVVLTGKIHALVLDATASRFLAGEVSEDG